MLKKYELLFILPGTLAENEVIPAVEKVQAVVEKGGGKEITTKDLGKSRIAYPIKHIRYGYFQLINFEAESGDIKTIRENIGLMTEPLRVIIQNAGDLESIPEKISAISDVTVRDSEPAKAVREESLKEPAERPERPEHIEHIEASHQIDVKKPAKTESKPKEKTETKAENIKMEDIDKKLDELLESNIADV